MDEPDQAQDFFVSYIQADGHLAEWQALGWEAVGYTIPLAGLGHASGNGVRPCHGAVAGDLTPIEARLVTGQHEGPMPPTGRAVTIGAC